MAVDLRSSVSPLVIPIFITHQGCPHRCIFCNQQAINGSDESFCDVYSVEQVTAEISLWLARSPRRGRRVQVAFYGGSFTGLPQERQHELLGAVAPFLKSGQVDEIRLSTRPDYIDSAICAFLKGCGVTIVELGIQSLDDRVLAVSQRGHSCQDSERAVALLRQSGMIVGGQLMVGLPGENTVSVLQGTRMLAAMQPDFVRLYPVLVIAGSALAQQYEQGKYRPLSLNRALALSAMINQIFAKSGIKVVRTGLQPSLDLEQSLLAGPYHPAFGELVKSRILFKRLRFVLSRCLKGRGRVSLAEKDRSIFYGQKRSSIKRLQKLGLLVDIEIVFSGNQERGTVLWGDC